MEKQIDLNYLQDLYERFKGLSPGGFIEINLEKLGSLNGKWEIPDAFRFLFRDCSIRIESAEIINRNEEFGKHTFMMYKMKGGEPGITFIN